MALYNPIYDTSPSAPVLQTDAASYVFGLSFKVTTTGCYINGVWWYVAATQYTNSGADEQIALWTVTGSYTGTYVASSVTTAGTYSVGWNLISFGSPIALTSGTEYMAMKGVSTASSSKSYCSGSPGNWFGGSGPGTNGFSEGPALVYSSDLSGFTGSSNTEPNSMGQQAFRAGSNNSAPPNVTTAFPTTAYQSGWYGMDVQISTTAAAEPVPFLSQYSGMF